MNRSQLRGYYRGPRVIDNRLGERDPGQGAEMPLRSFVSPLGFIFIYTAGWKYGLPNIRKYT
jgi:hypothetical protein